jgi:ubiquinone/menaquinone biosynthesis C-methylase UbiE
MAAYDDAYFDRYDVKNSLGKVAGERPYYYAFWERCLAKHLNPGDKVLEVACGPGYLVERLLKRYDTYAMDLSLAALERTRKRTGATSLLQATAESIPIKEGTFNAILAFDLIEHLPNPQNFIEAAHRLLKPNGLLILATPNPQSLGCKLKENRKENDPTPWEERLHQWHGWRDDTHINIQPIDTWRKSIDEGGFKILRDGSDFWWDTPYVNFIPVMLQKLFCNGINRITTYCFGFLPWKYGENYHVIAKRKA